MGESYSLTGFRGTLRRASTDLSKVDGLELWFTVHVAESANVDRSPRCGIGDFGGPDTIIVNINANDLVRWLGASQLGEYEGTEFRIALNERTGQLYAQFTGSKWVAIMEDSPYCSTLWAVFLLGLTESIAAGVG